jgi:hypothetical protein
MRMKLSLLLSCALIAASGAASAQAPPAPTTPPAQTAPPAPPRASECTPTQPAPQRGTIVPDGTTTGQRSEPLGDKLARSDGVLCPPAGVDPEIRAPTPDTGNTPVIPPPGSPGGDPNVRPK